MDGAGHLRTMWGVMLPMAKPIVVTFGLISLVGKWNEYLWPLIITNTDNMRPVTVGLRLLQDAGLPVPRGPRSRHVGALTGLHVAVLRDVLADLVIGNNRHP